jgi:hypothetical protein
VVSRVILLVHQFLMQARTLISFSVSMFVLGVVVIEVWETQLPVWAFVLALVTSGCFHLRCPFSRVSPFVNSGFASIVPVGVIQATALTLVPLNVISELMIGYALPGRPIAMMMFKIWGFNTVFQGLQFVGNLKLGHYMKIPPRSMFFCQVVATVIAGTVRLGVQAREFSNLNVEDICSHDQKDGFIAQMSPCSAPHQVAYCGFLLYHCYVAQHRYCSGVPLDPSICSHVVSSITASSSPSLLVLSHQFFQWIIHKKFKIHCLKYLNFPVIFASTVVMPPATPLNLSSLGVSLLHIQLPHPSAQLRLVVQVQL